jgi:hypothetical protein
MRESWARRQEARFSRQIDAGSIRCARRGLHASNSRTTIKPLRVDRCRVFATGCPLSRPDDEHLPRYGKFCFCRAPKARHLVLICTAPGLRRVGERESGSISLILPPSTKHLREVNRKRRVFAPPCRENATSTRQRQCRRGSWLEVFKYKAHQADSVLAGRAWWKVHKKTIRRKRQLLARCQHQIVWLD